MASFLASNAKPRIVGKNWEAAIRETLYVSPLLPSELKTDFHGISLYQPHGTQKKKFYVFHVFIIMDLTDLKKKSCFQHLHEFDQIFINVFSIKTTFKAE